MVASVDVLDRAAAALRGGDSGTATSPTADAYRPKLCPEPTNERKTTKSQNSIRYQEYVSNLPYGLAINVSGVNFDGCDPATGTLLEAKADIDFIFNGNGDLHYWVYRIKNPENQMKRQALVAFAAGRSVVWHAQTLKGYRGLSLIADDLKLGNLSVVYDPN